MEEDKINTSVDKEKVETTEKKPKKSVKPKNKTITVKSNKRVNFGKCDGKLFHFREGEVKQVIYSGETAEAVDKGVKHGFLSIDK